MDGQTKLKRALLYLAEAETSVEDDAILSNLHSLLHAKIVQQTPEQGVEWCRTTGVWSLIECLNHSNVHPCITTLAFKLLASLVVTVHGFKETTRELMFQPIMNIIPEPNTSKSADQKINSDSTTSNDTENKMKRYEINVSPYESKQLNQIESSVLSGVLAVVLSAVTHAEGRDWLIKECMVERLLAPCLFYPSLFIKADAEKALAQVLFHADSAHVEHVLSILQQCPFRQKLWRTLLETGRGQDYPALHLIYASLTKTTGYTLLEDEVYRSTTLFELLLQQYVFSTSSELSISFDDVLEHVLQRVKKQIQMGSSKMLKWCSMLEVCCEMKDFAMKCDSSYQDNLLVLINTFSELQVLPLLAFCSAEQKKEKEEVAAIEDCVGTSLCCSKENSMEHQIHNAVSSITTMLTEQPPLFVKNFSIALLMVSFSSKSLSQDSCDKVIDHLLPLLKTIAPSDNDQQDSVNMAAPSSLQKCLPVAICIITALVKKRGVNKHERTPEIQDWLCGFLAHGCSDARVIIPTLKCLQALVPFGLYPINDTELLQKALSRNLCHASWDVRDTCLDLIVHIFNDAKVELGSVCLEPGSVWRSVAALLDSDQPYEQRSAAAVVDRAVTKGNMSKERLATVHEWARRVCCDADSEADSVRPAAWAILASLHSGRECVFDPSCVALCLPHAQHCCTAGSSAAMRSAALAYVGQDVLHMTKDGERQKIGDSVVRWCSDGTARCMVQCCSDEVAAVRDDALKLLRPFYETTCFLNDGGDDPVALDSTTSTTTTPTTPSTTPPTPPTTISPEQADQILEEVLDHSDLLTLASIQRPPHAAPSTTVPVRAAALAMTRSVFVDAAKKVLSEGHEKGGWLSDEDKDLDNLLEDLLLGQAQDTKGEPLLFGPATKKTKDCY